MSRRRIGAYHVISKTRAVYQIIANISVNIKECNAELDTHANTYGVNSVSQTLEYTGQVTEVSGFANSLEPLQNIPIVKAAAAYNCPLNEELQF
jgi:hypothetical protein